MAGKIVQGAGDKECFDTALRWMGTCSTTGTLGHWKSKWEAPSLRRLNGNGREALEIWSLWSEDLRDDYLDDGDP